MLKQRQIQFVFNTLHPRQKTVILRDKINFFNNYRENSQIMNVEVKIESLSPKVTLIEGKIFTYFTHLLRFSQ